MNSRFFRYLLLFAISLHQFGCMSGAGVFVLAPLTVYQIEKTRESKSSGRMIHPSEISSLESGEAAHDDCYEFQKSLPKNFKQGFISVPFEANSQKKIKIFYYGDFDSKPTIFINGGPALSSHGVHQKLPNNGKGILFFDPRGTGCSAKYPVEVNQNSAIQISKFASTDISNDLEILARKFAVEKFLAHSFGGRIIHRMIEHQDTSIKSAMSWGGSIIVGSEWTKLRSNKQEQVSSDYFREYPDDLSKVRALRGYLKNKTFGTSSNLVSGVGLLDGAVYFLGWRDQWSTLHDWIQAMIPNGQVSTKAVEAFAKYIILGTVLSDGFAEDVITKVDVGGSEKELCQKQGSYQGDGFVLCRLKTATTSNWDLTLAKVNSLPYKVSAIESNIRANHIKFQLLAGLDDVFTPAESLDFEKNLIPDSITYIKSSGDHGSFFSSEMKF